MIKTLIPSIADLVSFEYDHLKNEEYEKIISSLLRKFPTSNSPKLTQVSGIPGSGKSVFCKKNICKDSLYLSFDKIMSSIPQYKEDIVKHGPVLAFERWEMSARIIGYELLSRAVKKKIDITFEHSGVNLGHLQLFENIKKRGYLTEVIFIDCDLEEAYKRVERREKKIKRHTPKKLIDDRHLLLDLYKNKYIKLADKTFFYKSSRNKFIPQNK